MSRAVTGRRSAIRNATSESWRISLSASCDTGRMYRTSCGDRRRPPPLGRDLRQAGAHRVLNHVVERVGVLLVALDQARAETAAEDVVGAAVDFVERTRVAAVQVAHSLRQVRLGRLDDEVVMVSHQAIGVDAPAIT